MLDFIYSIQGIEVNAQELKKTISWECVGKYEKRNTTELWFTKNVSTGIIIYQILCSPNFEHSNTCSNIIFPHFSSSYFVFIVYTIEFLYVNWSCHHILQQVGNTSELIGSVCM